ncbi:hypothetical protein SPHINGO391_390325 [Sphingomonas aurantiaca]|uniref:Uncharacterized protein n=1 Tax=Sphingomonas aurantiaca TaxID=185949 RepID=A0A5E7YS86_9SPHN|nr:hypothetical protein SPHINGO391_390325 [Sphingomonas aurantiaca]
MTHLDDMSQYLQVFRPPFYGALQQVLINS